MYAVLGLQFASADSFVCTPDPAGLPLIPKCCWLCPCNPTSHPITQNTQSWARRSPKAQTQAVTASRNVHAHTHTLEDVSQGWGNLTRSSLLPLLYSRPSAPLQVATSAGLRAPLPSQLTVQVQSHPQPLHGTAAPGMAVLWAPLPPPPALFGQGALPAPPPHAFSGCSPPRCPAKHRIWLPKSLWGQRLAAHPRPSRGKAHQARPQHVPHKAPG